MNIQVLACSIACLSLPRENSPKPDDSTTLFLYREFYGWPHTCKDKRGLQKCMIESSSADRTHLVCCCR
jgi:hypothetical protein